MFSKNRLVKEWVDGRDLPTVEVSEAKWVAARMTQGDTEEEAKFQARMAKGLGSGVRVGDEIWEIKAD